MHFKAKTSSKKERIYYKMALEIPQIIDSKFELTENFSDI